MNKPMDIWHFLAPIILEFAPKDMRMYVTVFHALKLEEEYQKEQAKAGGKNE
jgi:hypothetical protein